MSNEEFVIHEEAHHRIVAIHSKIVEVCNEIVTGWPKAVPGCWCDRG